MILRFFFLRELKKFPLFFFLLSFTILLGSLGLTGIRIVSQEVREKLSSRANDLLTSDFAVTARRDLNPEEKGIVEKTLQGIKHDHYRVIDIYSMVTHLKAQQSRLAEIRSVEAGFPFYGKILLTKGEFNTKGLFISRDLERLWNVSVGDELQVGEIRLKVAGIVQDDSSLGLRGFSLAPRIYLPLKDLDRSQLLRPGATGSYAYHYRFPGLKAPEIKNLKTTIYKSIKDSGVKVVLPQDSSEQTGRVIENLTNFMSLSALIGLILSLVGIFYLYQSHLLARLKDLCLMNLFGLSKGAIITGILGQFSAIFFLVFILQLLILGPIYRLILPSLSQNLGLDLEGSLNLGSVLQQLPFLYGLSLSILVPLLLGLMRTPMSTMLKAAKISMGRFRFYDFIPFVFLLWGFAWYLSNSLKTGNFFFFSLLGIFILSTLFILSAQWVLRKYIAGKGLLLPGIEAGIALRNLTRSGHKLTLSFLSLAMGATLISLILQLDHMIQHELALDENRPGLFIFDIQEEQIEELTEFAKAQGTPLEAITPMIRARLEKVNGKKYVRQKSTQSIRDGREDDEENRQRNTGLNLTYRNYLSPSEQIVEGDPFPKTIDNPERSPFISLEKRWAQRMGLEIGDKVTFDIQGVELDGVIQSIREIKWTSFYPNFFVSVEPGFLDGAPKTFLAVLGAGFKEKKIEFQRSTVLKFPNISFIDVEELVGKLSTLFEKSRAAIEVISLLSLTVGLVILYGLSHDQVYRRYYDLALMKSLGFSANRLRLNLILEFGSLFLGAMGVGLFLGWLMAQLIGKEVFKLPFSINWGGILWPGISLSILCLATILVSSWRAVRAKPRELLSDS